MTVFDLDGAIRWAFCMTHPDDEISICAWIRRLTQNGNQVFLSWAHSTSEREAEARAVADVLGVPQEHLTFFGAPDGIVVNEIPRLKAEYANWLASIKPDRVCCGAFEQGHIDHDATNFVINAVYGGPVFEIPFYHTYMTRIQTINRFADPAGQEIIHLSKEERRLKTRVAREYPSQNIWSVLLWYEALQVSRMRPIELRRTERMRLQTHRDFRRPNLPPALARNVSESPKWRRWLAVVEPVLNETVPQRSIPVRS